MTSKLSHKVATSVSRDDLGHLVVKCHGTVIVKVNESSIELNTGGWFTPTTKRRMNQTAEEYGLDFHVTQHCGKWFVRLGDILYRFTGDVLTMPRS